MLYCTYWRSVQRQRVVRTSTEHAAATSGAALAAVAGRRSAGAYTRLRGALGCTRAAYSTRVTLHWTRAAATALLPILVLNVVTIYRSSISLSQIGRKQFDQ